MSLHDDEMKVKPYRFGELIPTADDGGEPNVVTNFEMKSLKDAANFKNNISEEVIRHERTLEKGTAFSILPLVKEHRGLLDQEERDYEEAIEAEVERRLQELYTKTKEQAYQVGHQEGYEKAYEEGMRAIEEKVEEFVDMMNEVKNQTNQIIEYNKQDSIEMIKNLTKWITLKELEDEDYLSRLLNKLILEMNTKNNLIVRVNKKCFKYMPEVVEKVQAKVGELPNLRVEVDLDHDEKGIILESENGIIDASLEAQFKSLDKIFEAVSIDE